MTKLVERALVKDVLQIARADTRSDQLLDSLIQNVSAECERLTRRKFTYVDQVLEYHPSYDQEFIDPEPQFMIVDTYPIDTTRPLAVSWSPFDFRNDLFINLDPSTGDFDATRGDIGFISVRQMGSAASNLPFIGGIMFSYAPRGFKITYSGGYPITAIPSPYDDPDPMDDFGVTQVPDGLKFTVAKKVAADFRALRPDKDFSMKRGLLNPATTALGTFVQDLKPWTKKDVLF